MFFIAVFAVSIFSWKSEAFRFIAERRTAMFPKMLAFMIAPNSRQAVHSAIYTHRFLSVGYLVVSTWSNVISSEDQYGMIQ